MRPVILAAALVALASPSCASADPSALLAPGNPENSSGWTPPPPPTAGLKSFAPVKTKDWLQLNRDVTPAAGEAMGGMQGMGGMKGMGAMSGMGGMSGNGGKGGMSGMPGMSGMGGGK